MNSDRRLTRLTRGLTARERATLCVRAVMDGQPNEPAIRLTMPAAQVEEFNHLIALASGVHHTLLPHAFVLAKDVEATALRLLLLGFIEAGGGDSRGLSDRIRGDLRKHWADLLANERVAREVASEFGDDAVLPPGLQNLLARVRSQLVELRREASPLLGKIKWPRAYARTLASLRDGVRRDE